jgi:hypothetical protein
MSKQCNLASIARPSHRQRPSNHPIRPHPHLLHRLTPNNRVLPHRPPRNRRLYLLRSPALIHAVVPLLQPLIHHRHITKPGNLASLPSPRHRASQHRRKRSPRHILSHFSRHLPPMLRQRNIRPAGMFARRAPLRLPMPHQPQLRPSSHRFFLRFLEPRTANLEPVPRRYPI